MNLSREEIRILMVEKLAGSISAEDERLIDSLIETDDAVRDSWLTMQKKVAGKEFRPRSDVNAAWEEFAASIQEKEPPTYLGWKSLVAAAIITIVIFFDFYGSNRHGIPPDLLGTRLDTERIYIQNDYGQYAYLDSAVGLTNYSGASLTTEKNRLSYEVNDAKGTLWHSLYVPRVSDYQVRLSDGTEVFLNSQSRLRFPLKFSSDTREVYLKGEAYFKVAKNAEKPFIVHARGTNIRVTGTEFNVTAYDSASVKTSLVEGSVNASRAQQQVDLRPGYQAGFAAGKFMVNHFDQLEVLSWMKGIHYFHNASLEELSVLLSRWYRVSVVFENPQAKNHKFSGEISKHQPVEIFLENLKMTNNIRVRSEGRRIIFR